MSKYSALADLLRRQSSPVDLTFEEIDGLVGGLPASARRDRTWWANTTNERRVQAKAWMSAGWHVDMVNLTGGRVRFVKR